MARKAKNRQVNVRDAKTHLSRLLDEVARGRELVIARAGRPVAKLVPIVALPKARVPGYLARKTRIAPDFDAPLPDALLKDFES